MDPEGPLGTMAAPDEAIAVQVDGGPWVARKLDAMRAHATQITSDGQFFSGTSVLGDSMWSQEFYRLAAGTAYLDGDGWADDVFAGLDLAG
jgi:N-acetyl-1-D-myo-inositol-2-amino-2-deoxy-alpha-D-glucopyranoside deacetylase